MAGPARLAPRRFPRCNRHFFSLHFLRNLRGAQVRNEPNNSSVSTETLEISTENEPCSNLSEPTADQGALPCQPIFSAEIDGPDDPAASPLALPEPPSALPIPPGL